MDNSENASLDCDDTRALNVPTDRPADVEDSIAGDPLPRTETPASRTDSPASRTDVAGVSAQYQRDAVPHEGGPGFQVHADVQAHSGTSQTDSLKPLMKLSNVGRTVASVLILAGGIGGFLWLGTPEVPTRPPSEPPPPIVKTVAAEPHTEGIEFEVDGVVVPYREIQITAQVSGRVEFKSDNCRSGRAVKQGELLIRIEQKDYELEVKRLYEELKQAEANLGELAVEISRVGHQIELTAQQLEIDQREVERNRELVAARSASDSELDAALRAELNTRNVLQTLRDEKELLTKRIIRLESAKALVQANLDKAKLALERTEIRAPVDAVVVSENVEQDGYVQLGSPVVTLQDSSQLDVSCKLHMRQMHWLWTSNPQYEPEAERDANALVQAYDFPETPATVIYRLGGMEYQWDGVLNRYDGGIVDSQTRMIPTRVHVDDPLAVRVKTERPDEAVGKPPTLMTGMYVKIRIHSRPPIPLVRIPQKAVQPGNAVWTVKDSRLHRKDVVIATADSETVIAYQQEDGLQAGDLVIVSPLPTPVEGMKVHEFGKGPGPGGSWPTPGGGQWGGGPPGGRGGPPGARGGGPPSGRPGGKPNGGKPNGGRSGGRS